MFAASSHFLRASCRHVARRSVLATTSVTTTTPFLPRASAATFVTTSFKLPDPATDATHEDELTKIVATIGPTSEQAEPLLKVTAAGMKIMRLNFSHATKEEVENIGKNLEQELQKKLEEEVGNQLKNLLGGN